MRYLTATIFAALLGLTAVAPAMASGPGTGAAAAHAGQKMTPQQRQAMMQKRQAAMKARQLQAGHPGQPGAGAKMTPQQRQAMMQKRKALLAKARAGQHPA